MTKNKRFWYDFENSNGAKIVDFKTDHEYPLETIEDFRQIEDLLNELEKTIQHECEVSKALRDVARDLQKYKINVEVTLLKSYNYYKNLNNNRKINCRTELDLLQKIGQEIGVKL